MVTVEKLSFGYRKKEPVLENLDLALLPGHIYGLLGKNGAGKSSLLYTLCGLLFPQQGTVNLLQQNPAKRRAQLLQQIFLLPEEFYVPPVTIKRYADTHAPFYPSFDHQAFSRYLTEFEIPVDHTLQGMSQGQQKKVLISFALATRTRILLMDEPTNGLDIPSKKQFRKIIAGALGDDQIILISTHQVKDLDSLIDYVLVLEDKKIILHESIYAITSKLAFKQVMDPGEITGVLYSEGALKGHAVVSVNNTGETTKFDMEMFFNALMVEKNKILPLFNQH
jgi:ABC-2 type transport system ATP-binding protein